MRRTIFFFLGLLELAVGLVIVVLGCQFPSSAELADSFRQADRVTDRAGTQVQLLHKQVTGLRRLELQQVADRLQAETRTVVSTLRSQPIDFETVSTMRDALGDVAAGLGRLGNTLDPVAVGKLGDGLGATAAFLEDRVIPAAEQAARHLDQATAALRTDAEHVGGLLRASPLDFRAIKEVQESLGQFRAGLTQLDRTLRFQRLDVMREGFQGLETSLSTGAEQVERLAGYTYPAVAFNGLKPQVSQRQFWPEGDKIAQGMRKAAAGVTAAGRELDDVTQDLPKLRSSLQESGKVIDKLREALGMALEQREKVEPFLKDLPTHAARLAEELPKLGDDFARVLRDTRQLRTTAEALREAEKGIDTAVARWPELRTTLSRMAAVLKAAQAQLDQVHAHRDQYENAVRQMGLLGQSFANMLPLVTDQIDSRLDEEEQALDSLGQSLEEVRSGLPAYEQTAVRMLQTGRLLAWLVAAVVGLHGCYLLLSARMGRRYSL